MILHVVFLIVYLILDGVFSIGPTGLNSVLVLHCAIGILLSANKGKNYITPSNILYISGIVISIGNIIVESKIGKPENQMNSYMQPKFLQEAVFIWCIGATCIFLGYSLASKWSLPSIRFDMSKENSYKYFKYVLFIALFTGPIVQFFFFLGSLIKLISLIGSIGILFYARLWTSENDIKYRNYALILYLVQTFNSLQNSFLRNELILPTAVLMAGYFVGKARIKYLFSYRIVPFILIFTLFLTVFSSLGKNRQDRSKNFGIIISQEVFSNDDELAENDLFGNEEEEGGGFLDRSAIVAQLTNIVKLVKDHGFYDGAVSAPLAVALIPRFLWPDKPEIVIGMWFAGTIGQGQFTSKGHATNSINLTVPGECYIDFGWTGVVIGCIFFGMFISMLWNSFEFYGSSYNVIGTLYGGYLLVATFGIAPDLQIVITYLSTYLMYLALKKVITVYYS